MFHRDLSRSKSYETFYFIPQHRAGLYNVLTVTGFVVTLTGCPSGAKVPKSDIALKFRKENKSISWFRKYVNSFKNGFKK